MIWAASATFVGLFLLGGAWSMHTQPDKPRSYAIALGAIGLVITAVGVWRFVYS